MDADTTDARTEAARQLLADWVAAEAALAGEFSGSITDEYRRLIADAEERAGALGVPWDDNLVPEHVTDAIAWEDEHPHA